MHPIKCMSIFSAGQAASRRVRLKASLAHLVARVSKAAPPSHQSCIKHRAWCKEVRVMSMPYSQMQQRPVGRGGGGGATHQGPATHAAAQQPKGKQVQHHVSGINPRYLVWVCNLPCHSKSGQSSVVAEKLAASGGRATGGRDGWRWRGA